LQSPFAPTAGCVPIPVGICDRSHQLTRTDTAAETVAP